MGFMENHRMRLVILERGDMPSEGLRHVQIWPQYIGIYFVLGSNRS